MASIRCAFRSAGTQAARRVPGRARPRFISLSDLERDRNSIHGFGRILRRTKIHAYKKAIPSAKSYETDSSLLFQSMLENVPVNVMYADRDLKIQYMNGASQRTLKTIEHLLPCKSDAVIGQSIDLFHKNPAQQRRLLRQRSGAPSCRRYRAPSGRRFPMPYYCCHILRRTIARWRCFRCRYSLPAARHSAP